MDKETMFEYIQRLKLAVITLFKWLFCSVVCGCFIGSVGAVFHLMLGYVGSLRVEYPFLLFGLQRENKRYVEEKKVLGVRSDTTSPLKNIRQRLGYTAQNSTS